MKNLKGAITCLKMTETKPNFSELGRVYGVDRRTAKKMYEGQNAKSNTRDKPSKLDPYQEIIYYQSRPIISDRIKQDFSTKIINFA